MKYQLTAHEARVIGCLLEKQVTTPEQYPLSVNAVVTACNQKTNREPVMSLSESDVQDLLDTLVKRHYLRTVSGFGNRVTKYEQRFCNSEFGDLKLSRRKSLLLPPCCCAGRRRPVNCAVARSGCMNSAIWRKLKASSKTWRRGKMAPMSRVCRGSLASVKAAICICSAMIWIH